MAGTEEEYEKMMRQIRNQEIASQNKRVVDEAAQVRSMNRRPVDEEIYDENELQSEAARNYQRPEQPSTAAEAPATGLTEEQAAPRMLDEAGVEGASVTKVNPVSAPKSNLTAPAVSVQGGVDTSAMMRGAAVQRPEGVSGVGFDAGTTINPNTLGAPNLDTSGVANASRKVYHETEPEYQVVDNRAKYGYTPKPYAPAPTDNNMMEAISKLPQEEQRQALAEYLANGGAEAYREYMAMKDYVEDPEAAKKREKKERRNKNLIAAMNMIGALGNFASAAAHTDGRSVPVADTAGAYDKRLTAEREIRNQNLERANKAGKQYRDMTGGIIRQGYKNKQDRDKLAQQAAIEQMKAENTAARTAAYVRATEANQKRQDELLEMKKGKYALDAELGRKRLAIAQQRANQAAGNGGNGVSGKTHYSIASSGGVYNIRKERWNATTIGVAWSKLPENLRQDALKSIVSTMEPEQASEAMAALQALSGGGSTKWVTANANLLSIALGTVIDEPEAEALRDYLKSISDSGEPAGNAGGTGAGGSGGGQGSSRAHTEDPFAGEEGSGNGATSHRDDPFG